MSKIQSLIDIEFVIFRLHFVLLQYVPFLVLYLVTVLGILKTNMYPFLLLYVSENAYLLLLHSEIYVLFTAIIYLITMIITDTSTLPLKQGHPSSNDLFWLFLYFSISKCQPPLYCIIFHHRVHNICL